MPAATSKTRNSAKSSRSQRTSETSQSKGRSTSKRSSSRSSSKAQKEKNPRQPSRSKQKRVAATEHLTIDQNAPTQIDESPLVRANNRKREATSPSQRSWWKRLDRWFTIALVVLVFAGVGGVYVVNKWCQNQGAKELHPLSLSHLESRGQAFLTYIKRHWGPPTTKKHSLGYEREIQAAALHNHLKPAMLKAVIAVESNFQPNHVDRYGAMGLMQVTQSIASKYKRDYEALTPAANISIGAKFLAEQFQAYKDPNKALAAFHFKKRGLQLPSQKEQARYVEAVKKKEMVFLKDPGHQIRIASKNPPPRPRPSRVKRWMRSLKRYLSSSKSKNKEPSKSKDEEGK